MQLEPQPLFYLLKLLPFGTIYEIRYRLAVRLKIDTFALSAGQCSFDSEMQRGCQSDTPTHQREQTQKLSSKNVCDSKFVLAHLLCGASAANRATDKRVSTSRPPNSFFRSQIPLQR